MADAIQASISTRSFPQFETPEVAEEINSACTTLCGKSNEDAGAKELLDSLLKKRRGDAPQKKDEDARYLEFVEEEEKKVRQLLDCGRVDAGHKLTKAAASRRALDDLNIDLDEGEEKLSNLEAQMLSFSDPGGFDRKEAETGPDTAAQSKRDESLLRDYLRNSQDLMHEHVRLVKGNKKRIEALIRLIEKTQSHKINSEVKGTVFEDEIAMKDETEKSVRPRGAEGTQAPLEFTKTHVDKVNRAADLAVLHEHLNKEKATHADNLKLIESEEKKIAFYRRLLGEHVV